VEGEDGAGRRVRGICVVVLRRGLEQDGGMKGWTMWILAGGLVLGCRQGEEAGRQEPALPEDAAAVAVAATGEEAASAELAAAGEEAGWVSLVPAAGDGEWVAADFGGEGEVAWNEGTLMMTRGVDLTGVRWEGALPVSPYEIRLEARKMLGDDFFCGLTVPVRGKEGCVTLIVGGWGGATVGISSIGGLDASENETTSYEKFEKERWYAIRMVVREDKLEAWIDDKQVVSVETAGREIGLRPGLIELVSPLGVASYQTDAELRGLEWRPLEGESGVNR